MKRLATSLALAITGLTLAGEPCLADSPDSWFSSGFSMQQSGNLTEAIRMYTRAIEIDDRFVMAYQMRAAAWQQMRKYSKAIDDYSMVIAMGETSFKAAGYLNRGIVKNMSGLYSEAIPDFDQAIALDRFMGPAYFHRAIARSKAGDTIGNMDDFMQAARLGDPDAERWLDARNPGWRQIRKTQ
ncbi:MAG: tetratricopeptide repeat protein [Chlorobiaceae bacterium]|nr:tetratricopeptide repeat protein [Chlorobiales bacterium]NTU91489.1 tetratricopeptide repeat protein [Chlorobiaceae bacterium]NTV25699.1 tetratricopeptide repeat protein [Chlorobiaceae bacterium]